MPPSASRVPPEQFATFGELLRFLRLRAGLTQAQLSVAVGYSPPQISRLEHNRRLPEAAVLAARFVPALRLEDEPALAARLLALAAQARQASQFGAAADVPPAWAPAPSSTPHAAATSPAQAGLAEAGPAQAGHNLPAHLTHFIGRQAAVAEVRLRLAQSRLVTLSGPGGCGKTRLALQVAETVAAEFAGGAWLVELAALADPGLLPDAVAAVLRVRAAPGRSLADSLADALQPTETLLILDNCEHLVAACAGLAESLLRACRGLRILATSREALGVPGEALWPVPPLAFPPPGQALPPAEIAGFEAVQLFLERARAAQHGQRVDPSSLDDAARICRALEGMPLAIELAAARVPLLGTGAIVAWLSSRDPFQLLAGGSRAAPARHQSLQALLAWSYDLLPPPEQAFFCRLAVFAGSWTLEAAEAVCAAPGEEAPNALDLLAQLSAKSLVEVLPQAEGSRRYRLLETLRAFALERLAQRPDQALARQRHARYYTALAESAEPRLLRTGKSAWLERLVLEKSNFQAALEWAAENEAEISDRIVGALFWLWYHRGNFGEGRRWFEHVATRLAGVRHGAARARALWAAANCARFVGDLPAARALIDESIRVNQALGAQRALALALADLGRLEISEGRLETAEQHCRTARDIFAQVGDRWGVALSLTQSGAVSSASGRHEAAAALFSQSADMFRALDERGALALPLAYLGYGACRRRDVAAARRYFTECFEIWRQMVDQFDTGWGLEGLAWLAILESRPGLAARFFGAGAAQLAAINATLDWFIHREYDANVAAARAALGREAFEAAWAAGAALSLEAAMDSALAYLNAPPPGPAAPPAAPDSARRSPTRPKARPRTAR